MTPEHVFGGLLAQSLGIVGLLLTRKKQHKTEPVPRTPEPQEARDRVEDSRAAFRSRHGARELPPDLEGFALDRMPAGFYGFTYAPLTESPLFARQTTGSFEMHRSVDGSAYLIAYVAPEDRRRIEFGEGDVALKLYPAAHGDATEVVALETARLKTKKRSPSRLDGNWFEVTLHRS